MFQDLRYGVRMLVKHPGFTLVAVLTLALGIGINAAVFSVVDGVLLRPLPYRDADQLVRIWSANQETGQRFLETSYQDFQQIKEQARSFASMAAFSEAPESCGDAHREPAQHHGRAQLRTVSSQSLASRPLRAAISFLKNTSAGEDRSFSAIDCGRTDMHPIPASSDKRSPLMPSRISLQESCRQNSPILERQTYGGRLRKPRRKTTTLNSIISRLASGVSLNQAEGEVSAIAQQMAQASPKNTSRTAWVQTMQAMVVREVKTPLLVLLGAVAAVLLIACTNVAHLLLARGLSREREIAIRTALGAGRLRVVRQLLTESMLIATLGGAIGLFLGVLALKAIVLISPDNIPRLNEVALDGRIMAVMIAVTTLAGIIFGMIPALQASQLDPNKVLKGGSRGAPGSMSKRRVRQALVIAEVALATMLVISAGLLMKSFGHLVTFDHGFRAENVLVVPIPLRGRVSRQFPAFYEQVLEQVRALPPVESASLALRTPMEPQGFRLPFQIEGQPAVSENELPRITIRPIADDYFKTVAIPLLSGRSFDDRDRAKGALVAVVNQTFVETFFPQNEAVGKRLQNEGQSTLIVGVAGDVTPDAGTASRPMVYLPFRQFPVPGMSLLVRTASNPLNLVPTIRERIWALDPNVPLDKIYPLEQKVAEATTSPRFTLLLVGLFAGLGLVLAAVGIYGVMSFAVTERTKEIGIRRALGAQEAAIVWAVIRQGMTLALLGLMSGLVIAVWATRLMTTLLFGVSGTDPLTFAGVSSVMITVAMLACYIPARRATKVDPLVALRQE